MSSIGWVILDEQHRKSVMETMALFREPGTVDELGIGTIRDALSEVMFPGTSVLHTRAKYLLFVPWILDGLHRDGLSGEAAASEARKREVQLIFALLQQEKDTGSEVQGIIGRVARSHLKRLPSEIYWSALRHYRILRWRVSISGYCRGLRPTTGRVRLARDEDGNLLTETAAWEGLPEPEDLSAPATFDLTPDQATYLKDRIDITAPGSMLAWLIAQRPTQARGTAAPWQHPQLSTLPDDMRTVVRQAEWISGISHGAALLYNLMLAEQCDRGDKEDLIARYQQDLEEWEQQGWPLTGTPAEVWDVLLSRGTSLSPPARTFVEGWWRVAAGHEPVARAPAARQLIRQREFQLKKGRARLVNPRQLESWGGSSGVDPLTFRWPTVRSIAADIATPLVGGGDAVT